MAGELDVPGTMETCKQLATNVLADNKNAFQLTLQNISACSIDKTKTLGSKVSSLKLSLYILYIYFRALNSFKLEVKRPGSKVFGIDRTKTLGSKNDPRLSILGP